VRDKAVKSLWTRPKVSALLLTGRCLNRYCLASVAIQCFFDQTWLNKELVIVNHGEQSLLSGLNPAQQSMVREVRIKRPEGMTIGDMRNISMDSSTGDWLIQWDDDDWHHPLRIETQMGYASPETIVTFNWQVRCNLLNGAAFYDKMDGGQHMSVCYPRTTHRYERLNAREDTAFFKSFSKVITIDNGPDEVPIDPFMYVRFYHGMNIWDRRHIMGGSMQNHRDDDTSVELTSYHVGLLKDVLAHYEKTGARVP
jgi:glycosyltransferase involved in cell wall biosynthesis